LQVFIFVNSCYKEECGGEKHGNPTNDEILEDCLYTAASQMSLNINKYFSD